MNTVEFINYLLSLNIKLSVQGDRLDCHAPPRIMTKEIQTEIKERKQEIIEILAMVNQAKQPSFQKIKPISRKKQEFSLSFAQERLWFINQLEGTNSIYNFTKILELEGLLNTEVLKKAIAHLFQRHESLRTNFKNKEGKPIQIIHAQVDFSLPIINLEKLYIEEQEEKIEKIIQQEKEYCFNLEKDRLAKFCLLRISREKHILIISMHHIITDGWSMGILNQELSHLYQAYSDNLTPNLEPLTIQYIDFAVWQREFFKGKKLDKQVSYWQKRLAGIPQLIDLPLDKPRPPIQTFAGETKRFNLNQEITQKLKILAQNNKTTLYITLLTAFAILLNRYTHQSDLVIGSPIANRNRKEIEGLIGFFANNLALRINLSENPTFPELLTRVKEVALEAYEHQDLPFEKLVEELNPQRNLSHNPIFQVVFALQNVPEGNLKLEDLEIKEIQTKVKTAKFDLSLVITEKDRQLNCVWQYNTDLFFPDSIERMIGHWQILLEGIINNPNQKISYLPLLTEAEKQQILVDWNKTEANYPKDKCIHQLFEEQVAKTPDNIAVVFEEQQLTYRQLNEKANQLGHYLRKLGIKAETLVAICVERSLEMIIGILGILKAGGAYLPVDPHYPQKRISYILEDSGVKVLLTQNSLRESFRNNQEKIVCLDKDWAVIEQSSKDYLDIRTSSHNLAYVIYTSGSTGKPKGVAVEHQQIVNYLYAVLERFEFVPQSSFAMVSTVAADLGNTMLFPCLCTGGQLHLLSAEQVSESSAFAEYLSQYAIDYLKIVPSHLVALQNSAGTASLLPRRGLILGGEASSMELVKHLLKLNPRCKIFNHYGPTETTVGVLTYQVLGNNLWPQLQTLPLGRPLGNIQVYLLDPQLNPVPIGVSGEIYIGGRGVSRGYLNQPELTAEKFIRNPYESSVGEYFYKTGDLGRYLPDGTIEFLGRIDDQIKVRGFRVEPSEIKMVLCQHPYVSEAVVLPWQKHSNQVDLVAYIVPQPLFSPTIQGLPRYKLPNNLAVVHLNKNETDYIFKEVFELQAYVRHGITINPGDCVFDVGANIGLFTLFSHLVGQGPKIYAFEPNPTVFKLLKANSSLYNVDIQLFNFGLSDINKSATFSYFPSFSLLSGFYADADTEREVVKNFIINQQQHEGNWEIDTLIEQADEILESRFDEYKFSAELRTLSEIIRDYGIESIDLLKINVEKSELDVMRGIEAEHWRKIRQIVVEVDIQENLEPIITLLKQYGYDYLVDQDALLNNTQLCYIYAIRPSKQGKLINEESPQAHIRQLSIRHDSTLLSSRELKNFLKERLPEYMIPSVFVFLESLPLTPNGKIDKKALPEPNLEANREEEFVAPRNKIEIKLARIWQEVLGIEKIGINDNFFDLGGHSLLATQVVSRIRNIFQIELPLKYLFQYPTIKQLDQYLTIFCSTQIHVEQLAQEGYESMDF
jgi:amino acid adenylation domain-containing protein/FkbM family methyltransferase